MVKINFQAIKLIDNMAHNRKLVFSAVALVMGNLRNFQKVRAPLRDKIEKILIDEWFSKPPVPPFKWVGLIFFYGIKNDILPKYKRIDPKDGELPLTVELDMDVLLWADRNDVKLLSDIFEIATLETLIHVGEKYSLATDRLRRKERYLEPFLKPLKRVNDGI